jgi:hypothetical protein
MVRLPFFALRSICVSAASGEGYVGAGAGSVVTFDGLLKAAGVPRVEHAAALRARIKYGNMVTQAMMERNSDLALEAYKLGQMLPSTATARELRVAGYMLNGLLFEGGELVICYKQQRIHVLKSLDQREAARAREFQRALLALEGAHAPPHVTPFELVDTPRGKCLMIMPKHATTLEPLPFIDPNAAVVSLWRQVAGALEGIHAMGFAHADIKPSNICLNEAGDSCYLIDLGSVQRFGERTSSTLAYVPRDMPRGTASAALDWWMLAMTLAEKACGPDRGLEVGGMQHASKAELAAHLAENLVVDVWEELQVKLDLE